MASQQNSIKQNTWETYRHHGGVGVGVGVGPVAPVADEEGSVDAVGSYAAPKIISNVSLA